MAERTRAAQFKGMYQGARVHAYPVRVTLNKGAFGTVDDWCSPRRIEHTVIARPAAEAADYVRAEWQHRAETEIQVYGPRGGRAAYRYIGWYSAIGDGIFKVRRDRVVQGELFTAMEADGVEVHGCL